MVPVHIQGIEDPDGGPVTVRVTNITQDEPVGKGKGDDSCDASIDKDGNASVRARRDGNGDGRVYHVTFVATDGTGASCEGSVELCVPHDQGRHNECVDSGQNYHVDSACFAEAGGGGCSPTHVALFESPTPSCSSTLQATVGMPLTFTVKAGDADAGDVVQLGVTGLPAGAHLSTALPASGNPVSTDFTWTPAAGDAGSHVITFTAFDGCAAGPTQCSFTVNVNPAASCSPTHVALFESPTPSCSSTLQATVGTPLTFTVKAGDADAGDVVQLGVTGLPAGAQLSTALPASGNPVSTDFTWTPAAGDAGSHVITFTAFDGCAAGPTQCAFTVNVIPANGIDLKVTQLSGGVAQVEYTLPAEAQMSLAVYNVAGRRIATIVEGRQPAGTRSAQWVVTNPLRTIYFVQLRSGDKSVAKRIFFVNR